jgi:hypothetical protein
MDISILVIRDAAGIVDYVATVWTARDSFGSLAGCSVRIRAEKQHCPESDLRGPARRSVVLWDEVLGRRPGCGCAGTSVVGSTGPR